MSWTGNKSEYLRHRVEEVGHLRDKEQQHRFTKVPQDRNNSKRHAREITECVTDKHTGWVPVIKTDVKYRVVDHLLYLYKERSSMVLRKCPRITMTANVMQEK